MHILRKSLGAKILVLMSALTIAAFTGLFLANSYSQRSAMLEEMEHGASRTVSLVRQAIWKPMIVGDDAGTREQFETLSKNNADIVIYLTNSKGVVTYSTEKGAGGKGLSEFAPEASIQDLIGKSLTEDFEGKAFLDGKNGAFVAEVKSIPNEPSCHHCHGSAKSILGTMVMFQNVDANMATLRQAQYNAALISLAAMILLLGALLLFIKKTVINRVSAITAVSGRISQGEYDAPFDLAGQDELAILGSNLTTMVSRIKDQLEYNKGVLNGLSAPLFVADGERKMRFLNAAMAEILAIDKNAALGRPVRQCFYPGRTEGLGLTEQVVQDGQTRRGRLEYNRHDGAVIPLDYSISALRDSKGGIVGAIGVMMDMTQAEEDKERIRKQQENLLLVAEEVSGVALTLSGGSERILQRIEELSKWLGDSEAQTGQLATAMEEMNASVLEVSRNASRTSEGAEFANKVAGEGGLAVSETVEDISGVAVDAKDLAATLDGLAVKAEDIGRIMLIINDIADQTNLLALNAAIEAARAGESGRGFAVVADEVRKLAEKTMTATKEVNDAITTIQAGAKGAVVEMTRTRGRVQDTAAKAEKAGGFLLDIVKQSDMINDMVRGIASAAEEQSATSDEINNSLTTIHGLTRDCSHSALETAEDVREVAMMAQKLKELVAGFKHGGEAPAALPEGGGRVKALPA